MKRQLIKAAAAAVFAGALLVPASSADAVVQPCVAGHCDSVVEFWSDATHTVRVGEYEDGDCGYVNWGVQTQYVTHWWRTC